jgi:hypothetical protein
MYLYLYLIFILLYIFICILFLFYYIWCAQDWANFFENVSYEIGGDVFSLAELEYCVVGGKLEMPASIPRGWCAPPPSGDDHYVYALQMVDRRVRLSLNSSSLSNSSVIYMFRPETMQATLESASLRLINTTIRIDLKKRTVLLPKVCDMYRNDFGGSSQEVLKTIVQFVDGDNKEKLLLLISGARPPVVKYHDMKCQSHDSLQLIL